MVAGAAGGLGRAVTLDLAAAGAALALCDRDGAALTETAEVASAAGADVLEATFDVRDSAALTAFFDRLDDRFGRLDVLVNVVGGTFRSPFTEVSAKGRDALVAANFTWLVESTQLAALRMAGGDGGSIVMLTSIEAHRAAPGFAVYAAMKAAVTHLARTLAVELGPAGIRVNCVAPDFVPTAGLAAVASSAGSGSARAAVSASDPGDAMTIPLGRKGRPEDVTNCVLFLASDLSAYVTGTTLHPDGGALAASGWWDWPGEGFVARPPASVLDGLDAPRVSDPPPPPR